MKKPVKILLIVGIVLVVVGGGIAAVGFISGGFPNLYWSENQKITEYKAEDLVTMDKTEIEAFSAIDITTELGSVEVIPGDSYSIQCSNFLKDRQPSYEVKDGTLFLHYKFSYHGIMMFGEGIDDSAKITVTVPNDAKFSSVNIIAEGEILVKDLATDHLVLNNEYGDALTLENVKAENAEIAAESSNLVLKKCSLGKSTMSAEYGNVQITECQGTDHWILDAESGEVTFDNAQLATLECDVEYGSLTMKKVSSKGLDLSLESGDADISGDLRGKTEIDAGYGNITLNLTGAEAEYGYLLKAEYGDISIDGKKIEGTMHSKNNTADQMEVECESGSIGLNFSQSAVE